MPTLSFDQYHAMRAQMYQTACISSRSAGSASFWAIADHAMKDGGYVCGPEPGSRSATEAVSDQIAAARKEERERVLEGVHKLLMQARGWSNPNETVEKVRAALEKE